ncbi:MAG: DUF2273 domain-containing protein [Syntrophomonadaceae bacterium]
MFEKYFTYIMSEHRGKAIGVTLGLLASILFITFGFWQTLFVVLCIFIGYQLGKKIDQQVDLELWVKNLFKK